MPILFAYLHSCKIVFATPGNTIITRWELKAPIRGSMDGAGCEISFTLEKEKKFSLKWIYNIYDSYSAIFDIILCISDDRSHMMEFFRMPKQKFV